MFAFKNSYCIIKSQKIPVSCIQLYRLSRRGSHSVSWISSVDSLIVLYGSSCDLSGAFTRCWGQSISESSPGIFLSCELNPEITQESSRVMPFTRCPSTINFADALTTIFLLLSSPRSATVWHLALLRAITHIRRNLIVPSFRHESPTLESSKSTTSSMKVMTRIWVLLKLAPTPWYMNRISWSMIRLKFEGDIGYPASIVLLLWMMLPLILRRTDVCICCCRAPEGSPWTPLVAPLSFIQLDRSIEYLR